MNSKFVTVISLLLLNIPLNAQEELYPVSRLLWGNSKTHFVTEDNAFIGAGGAILIGNIVSTDSLEVLHYFYLPTTVNDIYVENNILYALDYREGLFIYNISDIYNPVLLSELNLGNYCYDFTYDSNYVYIALGANGIKKVNVSDLSSPYVETESSIRAFNIQKFQSYLYCIPGYEYIASDSISILYSSDLVQGGTLNAVGYSTWIEGIYFNENKGFLLEWFVGPSGENSSAGIFTILNLSNPLNPQRLGNLVVYDYFFEGVSCIGDTVLAYTCTELFIINAQTALPSIISQTPGLFINSCSANFSSVSYPHFYLSYDYAAGFLIIDIGDLLNPEQGYYLNTNNATEVVWLKDSLLFAGGGGIYMVDVSDMSNPVLIKRFTENVGTVRDIKTNDSLLFAASNTFKIFKIHDNDSLSFFSELDYGSQSSQVAIDDTLAAVGGRYWGLHLIDISDPTNPLYIKNVPLPAGLFYVKHMAFQNNKLIVSDYQRNTPVIYDVSDPNNPVILYEGNYATTAFCIAESDTVLFVGDSHNDELVVLNIKDLNNVYEISSIPVLGYPSRIEDSFVNDNLLFLTCFNQDDYDSYLRIYDVSDLNNIVELRYAFLPEWAVSVCANNNISVVSDFYDGLYIYDISDFIPVELLSFTARVFNNDIQLSWITATETNNMGFEIQRLKIIDKDKLTEWKKIGFIEGKGTTTETQSYSFIDPGPNIGHYSYRLKQIDFDGSFEYSQIISTEIEAPGKFALFQNYPNPFNPVTVISYQLPVTSNVTLKVYDVLGNEIATLINEELSQGKYEVIFDGSILSSTIYYYQLIAGNYIQTRKMLLLK